MAYVPGFRYDLFFSYASQDNVDGWVEKFQGQLTSELARLLGRPFSEKTVYLDKIRLNVCQAYPQEMDQAARYSALLTALLSPSYVTSEWCARERRVFRERLPEGATFAECLAAVGVCPTDDLPDSLRQSQRKDFFAPGSHLPWPSHTNRWLEEVHHLAVEIKVALQRLRQRTGSVFLGAILDTHINLRGDLAEYLSEHHFRATPNPALLEDRIASQRALCDAACAVHFVGGASDAAIEAIEDSIKYCAGPTVLFQPFGAKLTASEELFLSGIPEERYPHFIGPNETELKKFLEELLTRSQVIAANPPTLGLVCEPADFSWAEQFRAHDLAVDYPRFLQQKLTNMERIRFWRQMVQHSHGLIFYQGLTSETLLQRVWQLAEEEHSQAVRLWYVDHPDVENKRARRQGCSIYPQGLENFVDKVRNRAVSQRGLDGPSRRVASQQ
jgi:hypothetical protein